MKQKKINLLFIFLFYIFSCGKKNNNEEETTQEVNTPKNCSDSSNICIKTKEDDDGVIRFFYSTKPSMMVAFKFDVPVSENLEASHNLPILTTITEEEETEFFTLRRKDPSKGASYSYSFSYYDGAYNPNHDDNVIYNLPFEGNKKFIVSQGYGGKFSHTSAQSYYALDFNMKEGDQIHAARDGIVIKVISNFNEAGTTDDFKDKANVISILHSDGTVANYAHLQQNGSKVKVGETVSAGDFIGISGNTGFSSGPHLHFSVQKINEKFEIVSIPTKFKVKDSEETQLQEGASYEHPSSTS